MDKKLNNKFVFKILSVGSFEQIMRDEITILNRPCVFLKTGKKKWGNEYLLFNDHLSEAINAGGNNFLGIFGIDKTSKCNIRLIKFLDIPVRPDYYILVMKHQGEKIEKMYDLKKADPESFSKIFSAAYHLVGEVYECETMFILRHNDEVTINDTVYRFSAKTETLEAV
jgi:hypothetical protein